MDTMTREELEAQIEMLKKQNQELKTSRKGRGSITVRSSALCNEKTKDLKDGKGTVSVYGLGTRPITAYPSQWLRIIRAAPDMYKYIEANIANLGFKTNKDRDETAKGFHEMKQVFAYIDKINKEREKLEFEKTEQE